MKNTAILIALSLLVLYSTASFAKSAGSAQSGAGFENVQEPKLGRIGRKFRKEVNVTVNFDINRDLLNARAKRYLDAQAIWLLSHPNTRFSVYGYTNNSGGADYDSSLGMRRADRVIAYLVSRSVGLSRTF